MVEIVLGSYRFAGLEEELELLVHELKKDHKLGPKDRKHGSR